MAAPSHLLGPRRTAIAKALLSYGLAAACLFWIFRDIDFSDFWRSLTRVNWSWVPLAVASSLLTYGCVAWEWQFLLRPLGHLSLVRLTQAVLAGRFANDVLPVHIGYVIRVYLAARWMQKSVGEVVPSLVVERLFDGLWLGLGIGVVALFVKLPAEVVHTGQALGIVIFLGIGVITGLLLARSSSAGRAHTQKPPRRKWLQRALSLLDRILTAIRDIAGSRWFAVVVTLSLLKMILQALAFVALLWAYHFAFPFWVELAIFLIACVGISLPSTPAGAGVFQVFCIAGLRLFGVEKPVAAGFALLAFVILTAPLSLAGFLAVAKTEMTLGQIRAEAGSATARPGAGKSSAV